MVYSVSGPVIGSVRSTIQNIAVPSSLLKAPGLPSGFPLTLDSPLVWSGSQFEQEQEYLVQLVGSDVKELENALKGFKEMDLDGDLVSRDNFILPTLGLKLEKLRTDVYQGRGFGVLRGLDPQQYSVEDLTVLYLGIQVHVANQFGRQDKKGNMLVHIIADSTSKIKADHHRHSTAPITFHNEEAGDIVSWLTRSTALAGGKCIIASAYTIYNVLAASRPDLVRTLAQSDWPFALPHFHCRPVIFHYKGRLIMNFSRAALRGSASHERSADLPAMTCSQSEALDAIENIAKTMQLEIRMKAGDVHFINNLAILHRREGFINGSTLQERRHLVRMRLRDDQIGWDIPAHLQHEWGKTFDPKLNKVWHLQPMPDGFFPLRTQPN